MEKKQKVKFKHKVYIEKVRLKKNTAKDDVPVGIY